MNDTTLKRRAKASLSRIPVTAQRVIDRVEAREDAVKDYLRKIGSKGGRKSAQHPDRRRLNRLAAESRWRKRLPQPKELVK